MTAWFTRFSSSTPDPAQLQKRLGPLEWRVLEALWQRAEAASVRDLQPEFADIAYTTLMTTLDRLHRKGVLSREKQGRAFLYRPELSRPQFESARAADAFRVAVEGGGTLALSYFVQAVGDHDGELLDELETLVKAHRAELRSRRG
jgi:predicted transcriptional regulator